MSAPDARSEALIEWMTARAGSDLVWRPVAGDASRRRYFRVRSDAARWIAVDAPPPHENVDHFVTIARLMETAGLNVPRVIDHDAEKGFMWLTDLGDQTYLDVLEDANADRLFEAAIDALIDWQCASRPGVLPDYDRATFAREMALFIEWYLPHECGYAPNTRERDRIEAAFGFLLDRIASQPPVFVHRDYMPRNLMISRPMPGVLDFQDARYGPAAYDVASLFRDAFISWPEVRVDHWTARYWERARARGVPLAPDWAEFRRDVALTGAQRHLKILGLFVRIAKRDGKSGYAEDLDRFRDYLRPVVHEFSELAPLAPFIDGGG